MELGKPRLLSVGKDTSSQLKIFNWSFEYAAWRSGDWGDLVWSLSRYLLSTSRVAIYNVQRDNIYSLRGLGRSLAGRYWLDISNLSAPTEAHTHKKKNREL